jgi:hypothetical protein
VSESLHAPSTPEVFQIDHEFTLPNGYVSPDGTIHRHGTMRMATAFDEIAPQADVRVQRNPAYLVIILLARVTALDGVHQITPNVIENLFVADLTFLQALYNRVNSVTGNALTVTCPRCEHVFDVEVDAALGES